MIILSKEKLEGFLTGYAGDSLKDRLADFCQKHSTGDPNTSPHFEKVQVSSSGLITWVHGENLSLVEKLRGLEWQPLK